MRRPNFGKPRSISGAISSVAKKLSAPKPASPSRPRPNVGKPASGARREGRKK